MSDPRPLSNVASASASAEHGNAPMLMQNAQIFVLHVCGADADWLYFLDVEPSNAGCGLMTLHPVEPWAIHLRAIYGGEARLEDSCSKLEAVRWLFDGAVALEGYPVLVIRIAGGKGERRVKDIVWAVTRRLAGVRRGRSELYGVAHVRGKEGHADADVTVMKKGRRYRVVQRQWFGAVSCEVAQTGSLVFSAAGTCAQTFPFPTWTEKAFDEWLFDRFSGGLDISSDGLPAEHDVSAVGFSNPVQARRAVRGRMWECSGVSSVYGVRKLLKELVASWFPLMITSL